MNIRFGAKVKDGRVRVFRHPQTGDLKIRIQGEFAFPASAENVYLSVETFMDIGLEDAMALDLRDQLLALIGPPEHGSELEPQGFQAQGLTGSVPGQELG